jgi:hypothetical protein
LLRVRIELDSDTFFYYHMTSEAYPQAMTADESAAGFQRLLIDGIGDPMGSRIHVVPVPVVARILDSSDVLIKIYDLDGRVAYSHRRWGRDSRLTPLDERSWYPIHTPMPDFSLLIDNYKTGRVPGMFEDEIIGFAFKHRAA